MRYWRSIAQGSTSGCISTPDDVELLKTKGLGLVPVNYMLMVEVSPGFTTVRSASA
jgi:hypothetical protein